ncbi:hypothetical protein ACWDGI_41725 [Streptomyces sp. NPDC001220]
MSIDWRTLEDSLLRRALKAESFRVLYGGAARSADGEPVRSVTGRMTVHPPAYHPIRPGELSK